MTTCCEDLKVQKLTTSVQKTIQSAIQKHTNNTLFIKKIQLQLIYFYREKFKLVAANYQQKLMSSFNIYIYHEESLNFSQPNCIFVSSRLQNGQSLGTKDHLFSRIKKNDKIGWMKNSIYVQLSTNSSSCWFFFLARNSLDA